jgi:CHAT domain-containing protein
MLPLFKLLMILIAGFFYCAGNLLPLSIHTAWASLEHLSAETRENQGLAAFQRGDFEQAANHWIEASRLHNAEGMLNEEIDTLIKLSDAYLVLGRCSRSLQTLQSAWELASKANDGARLAAVLGNKGKAYLSIGMIKVAERQLKDSIEMAQDAGKSDIEAFIINEIGNLQTLQKEYGEALYSYDRCINLAGIGRNQILITTALINATKAAVQWENFKEAKTYLESALEQTRKLDDSYFKAYGLISLGQLAGKIASEFIDLSDHGLYVAYQTLTEAFTLSETFNNSRMKSYALGYLGKLYEDEKRIEEALVLTQRAIFEAQQSNAPEILYKWQWQKGRLLKAHGNIEESIAAYKSAVENLRLIRQDVYMAYRESDISFRDKGGKVFLELADLLFKWSESQTDHMAVQNIFKDIRNTIESLRMAELQDYFQDECVVALQKKEINLEQLGRIGSQTVIIYPIIFPDRLEILLNLPDEKIKRFTTKINSVDLKNETLSFRRSLEKISRGYEKHAQRLYDYIIRPFEDELITQKIDTLVFIPDDFLRTVPMSALNDGKLFLIEKFAIANMPGRITLTKPTSFKFRNARPLLCGLTKPVQGNRPLPQVAKELEAIQRLYGGKQIMDEDFKTDELEQELKSVPYNIVHMATHGKFEDNIKASYLLVYDGKLSMNDLEKLVGLSRFRQNPVELLTLSACETAAGDDRAALGLAGVALKAGAQSALASLWFVSDEIAALLVPEFYRQLKDDRITKAEALRQAQLKIFSHEQYQHPGFWSAFLLTGNWL